VRPGVAVRELRFAGSVLAVALALPGIVASRAGAATTSFTAAGTIVLNGAKIFPIVLAKGPPRSATTPSGTDALDEVVAAGVNFFKVGPATTPWTSDEIAEAIAWNRAAAARGVHTWINLSTLGNAVPGSAGEALLRQVVGTLMDNPAGAAVGMWKGVDEPWWGGFPPSSLQFAYCLATSRRDLGWCAGEAPLDSNHLWVTIQAPRGTASDLAPYSAVTDVHGVDIYPVTLGTADPDLHQVGLWTSTIASVSPDLPVWTTLQVCASGSYDSNGSFVLPAPEQERFMIYDSIINGARAVAFYGGNIPGCWSAGDRQLGWNWTFWNNVLKGLIAEINARSPLAPALVNPDSTAVLPTDDPTTEAISRRGATVDDLWVIAARSGADTQMVTIKGLPDWADSGSAYTEERAVAAKSGALTDAFGRWAVHVYHFIRRPAISAFNPAVGGAGTEVAITGTGLSSTSDVQFNGVAATYRVDSDERLTAVVPRAATTGPITVRSPGGSASSETAFAVSPTPIVLPQITGAPRTGRPLQASPGEWSGTTPIEYTYLWQRCDSRGLACASVGAARAATYVPGAADLGSTLRVVVTAANSAGSAAATSSLTSQVRDATPPKARALASSGRARRPIRLRYTMTDNSGRSGGTIQVRRGRVPLARLQIPIRSRRGGVVYSTRWRRRTSGRLLFCVVAVDAERNRSRASCAPLRVASRSRAAVL
jgi:hypothetical protein